VVYTSSNETTFTETTLFTTFAELEEKLATATKRFLTLPPDVAELAREEIDNLRTQVEEAKGSVNIFDEIDAREEALRRLSEEHARWREARALWEESNHTLLAEKLAELIRIEVSFETPDGKHSKWTEIRISLQNGDSQETILPGLYCRLGLTHYVVKRAA